MSVPHDTKTTGERIKHARTAAGISQPQLAHAIEQAARRKSARTKRRVTVPARDTLKTQISFWENGHREPGDFYRPLLADALGMPESDLFPPTSSPAALNDEAAAELHRRISTAGAIDAGTVELLRAQTHQLRLLDRRLGGRELLGQLRSHVATVQGLLAYAVLPAQRTPLATVLTEAATLAGWQALDTGATTEAWQHYETAKSAARETDSSALIAHAMGEQAYVLQDLGRPADALALNRAAHATASGSLPPLLTCWLTAAAAELSAAAGDADQARRGMDFADRTLPGDYADPALPYLMLAPAHLERWRGAALARIGDAGSIAHLYAALDGMGDTTTLRAEAGLRVDLVAALTASGNRDQAATEAALARDLTARAGSTRLRRRLDGLAA